jgi:hypothetical protein
LFGQRISADYELKGKFTQYFERDLNNLIPSELFQPSFSFTTDNIEAGNIQARDFSPKGSAETPSLRICSLVEQKVLFGWWDFF